MYEFCYSLHRGLNSGPSVYKTDALPLSYKGGKIGWLKKTWHKTIYITISVYYPLNHIYLLILLLICNKHRHTKHFSKPNQRDLFRHLRQM